jgi:hypothetical protein
MLPLTLPRLERCTSCMLHALHASNSLLLLGCTVTLLVVLVIANYGRKRPVMIMGMEKFIAPRDLLPSQLFWPLYDQMLYGRSFQEFFNKLCSVLRKIHKEGSERPEITFWVMLALLLVARVVPKDSNSIRESFPLSWTVHWGSVSW